MEFTINKNSEEKETSYCIFATFQAVGLKGSIYLPKQNLTAQEGQGQTQRLRLFLVRPKALSQRLSSLEIRGVHESSFPRSLLCGLRKERTRWGAWPCRTGNKIDRGPSPGRHVGSMGCRVRVPLPGISSLSQPCSRSWDAGEVATYAKGLGSDLTLFLQEGNIITGLCPGQGDGHSQDTRITHLTRLPVLS